MSFTRVSSLLLLLLFTSISLAQTPPDWTKLEEETLRHFQAILRLDTSNPPGNEKLVVDYLKSVLDREGIETKIFANDPNRPNLVARLRGNGKKRPVLIMGHTDVVKVDPAKWTHPPFSATRDGGYVYGRGTVDDKDNVVACLMVMLQLKRLNVPLDRDVIFLAEAGEEASTQFGIAFMVEKHWPEIDAEFCFAEGGGVIRTGGKIRFAQVQTSEKIPYGVTLTARGPAGHGSVPLRTNAVVHLSQAIAKLSAWSTPMRLNDTTKAYFERLAAVSSPEEANRYRNVANPEMTAAIQEYFAVNEPRHHSMLRTSISPNIIKGGYQVNVIPSEAEATLDVRALPDENMESLLAELRKVINDPAVTVARNERNTRPGARPSRIDAEAFRVLEAAVKQHYNTVTLPTMSTGATDMAYLRAKGVECYGVGPMYDSEDGPKGFGAHSDQERILEESLHKFVRFHWDIVVNLAKAK
ncbi:MAG: M20/M25/M40 family metallo-hydrolase [Acidobacteria bacterium]|jgi:acetylornithine deacetylase/succinyl-diaminopimelate desuccinylase-like protein|nr:M20/M25/M40 family metallo-hydrolase [Acidobacteriota bacterium]